MGNNANNNYRLMKFMFKSFVLCNVVLQLFYSCTSQTSNINETGNSNIWKDRLTNVEYPLPDTIAGEAVSFYLQNPKINQIAKAFFEGKYRPSDNDSTELMFSDITTPDSKLRPFYRWCLDFTISISDGALGEYLGIPAFDYARMYPQEFFEFIDKDKSGQRYQQWIEMIAYSGLNNYDDEFPADKIIGEIESNCLNCNQVIKERISYFIKDIEALIKNL